MLNLIEQIRDPYERKARLTPGLLVVLPLLVPIACVFGPKNPVITTAVGLFGSCGAVYLLASIARGRGKVIEDKLSKRWGGMPTTISLRHRDEFFDRFTKDRYHKDIATKLAIEMPTPEDEANDPARADEAYVAATRRLRELTRGDSKLLFKENIAYGFHRNMLGVRWIGILTAMLGFIWGLVLGRVISLFPLSFGLAHADMNLAAGLTIATSLALLLSWVFYISEDKVRRIGFVYAERLFERLPSLRVGARTQKQKPDKR